MGNPETVEQSAETQATTVAGLFGGGGMTWRAGVAVMAATVATGLALVGGRESHGESVVPADERARDLVGYFTVEPTDPISRLQKRIDRGEVKLAFDRKHGWLPALLQALKAPVSSQSLVFSKTSFQLERISPRSPRAIYFGDDAYVGAVQGSELLEISAVDPVLGATFYVLRNVPGGKPRFVRQTYDCLQCHESGMTSGVPGHMVRSVYPTADGRPDFASGTYLTSDASPYSERFGGWYVTGKHGAMRHMGNATVRGGDGYAVLDRDAGANLGDLSGFFDTKPYLAPGSDIVAQLVLQHQVRVHDLITQAHWGTLLALSDEKAINDSLGRGETHRSDSTKSRIRSVCEPLVEALLFVHEPELPAPIVGSSSFTKDFAGKGIRDRNGRSLRQFDLRTRLFRYPCSFLIHSEAFSALPEDAKEYVFGRLRQVADGSLNSKPYDRIAPADRKAIGEILRETLLGFDAEPKEATVR